MLTDKDLIKDLSSRLAGASAALGALAEKNGCVKELLRLKEVLRTIASGDEPVAKETAIRALRW